MPSSKFQFTDEEAALLLEFESTSGIQELALRVSKDPSVISRSLTRISQKHPVVEKKLGRWTLTDMGRKINQASRAYLDSQSEICASVSYLRLGTNREFAAKIVGPEYPKLVDRLGVKMLVVSAFEAGVEDSLLAGRIDLGIDCDRPNDPEISYRLLIPEPIVAVASPRFCKAHKIKGVQDLLGAPHLLCDRLSPEKILKRGENQYVIAGRFNDIATARAVCLTGAGWALLPHYTVSAEIQGGDLVAFEKDITGISQYGVWWPRKRKDLKPRVDQLSRWLKSVAL